MDELISTMVDAAWESVDRATGEVMARDQLRDPLVAALAAAERAGYALVPAEATPAQSESLCTGC